MRAAARRSVIGGTLMSPISRGFFGRRRSGGDPSRVPPGQHVTNGFPVLSAGPTPHTPLPDWSFTIDGAVKEAGFVAMGGIPRAPGRADHR